MEIIENKEQERAFLGISKRKDRQIQLSSENLIMKRKIRWEKPIQEEYLFIVPWQQVD